MEKAYISNWSIASTVISVAAAALLLLAGYGYQWNWWELGTAFTWVIPFAAVLGLIGIAPALIFAFTRPEDSGRKGAPLAWTGALLGIAVIGTVGYWYMEAQQYPPIHDITTDTENPPQFDAVLPLRADAPNPSEYGGKNVAETQKQYYPDVQPLFIEASYEEAFERALEAVREMPWEDLVDVNREEGRIEATDKLAWFGFKDDVVIRVDTADTGSRIDVRSVSRIGRGDIGVNAGRIRDYLEKVRDR